MSLTTDTPDNRREKLKKLREHHQHLLDKLGVPDAVFIPKMAYRPYGKSEIHISFFLSEINKGEDIYTEFTSKELVSEDPTRTLYKWKFNPHFEEEYDKTDPHPSSGHIRYLIPVGELVPIKEDKIESVKEEKQAELKFDIPDPESDLPVSQMTIRDLAAILLKKPVSNKKWLNKLIE